MSTTPEYTSGSNFGRLQVQLELNFVSQYSFLDAPACRNINAQKNMDSKTSNKLIQEALCLLLEVQETLYTKLRLHPLEELRKSIQIVEYKNKRQFHLVDRWLFELVRMFYDAGYLRGVSEETCDFLLCKIERIQSLLKKASE